MLVFLNGQYVPEERALVSIFDRGFLYGDGLFEAIRIFNGRPFRFQQHIERLRRGADFLHIRVPLSPADMEERSIELLQRNQFRNGVLRVTLSRGAGTRGYSPKGADSPTLVMNLTPLPAADSSPPRPRRLITSTLRVPANDPLACHKTCSKLQHVLARAEADASDADDALLVNTSGEVTECTSSNIFWLAGETICTTPAAAGLLPGITRGLLLELCREENIPCEERTITPGALRDADAAFLTLSSLGIVEAASLDGITFRSSRQIAHLSEQYWKIVERETA